MHVGVPAHRDEPVSRPEAPICLGWVVQYFPDIVAIVQLASSDGESKASAPELAQNHRELKLFNQSLTGNKQ